MDEGIRKLLKEHYQEMMNTITEPYMLACNISVLTPVDLERIQSETRERGSSTGVFELLNRLQKRGPQAFPQLIEALRKWNFSEIAGTLEEKARYRNLYRPVRQASHDATGNNIPVVARGPWQRPPQAERSLSYPVQPSSLNHQESTEEVHASQSTPVLYTHIDLPGPELLEEAKPQKTRKKGKESFLKDIPSNLKDKIVNMLNNEDALGKDWRGVAGELQLTAEEQGQVKSCSKTSPMDELFNQMLHRGYRVSNLINILIKIDRHDVIGEIKAAGFQDLEGDEVVLSPTQVADESAANKFDRDLLLPGKTSDDSTEEEKKREVIRPAASPLTSPTDSTMKEKERNANSPTASPLSPTSSTAEEKKREVISPTASPLSPTNSTVEEKEREVISPAASPVSPTRSNTHSDNLTAKELDEKKEEKGDARYSTTGLPSPKEVSGFGSDDPKKKKNGNQKGSSTADRPSEAVDGGFGSDKEEGAKGLPSPTQVSHFDSLEDSKLGKKKDPHLSEEIEDAKQEEQDERDPLTDMTAFEEEIFIPDAIQAKAIFITCEKYQKTTKLTNLNQQVKKLAREMEDNGNWEVNMLKDHTSAKLKSEWDSRLLDLKKSKQAKQSDVCFVYLAGHTLQINGENYFLPKDVELNLSAADIIDSCLNINSLVKELSENALMALIIVDGGHYNEEKFECPFALPGLTSIIPHSNTVVAFPCQPGYIRSQEESLLYLKALISVIEEKKHLALTDLFGSVREALKDSQSLPVEFSLSPSLLPIYLNASEKDDEGVAIRKPDENTPRHAIVFCDHSFDKKTAQNIDLSANHLETSLNQLGWKVERYSNLKPNQIKMKIRQSLKGLPEMNVFMLYFIGYVTKDKHSIGQESWEVEVHVQKLPIQWLVNIMSEYITGPKILIVDDPSVPLRKLSPVTALPQEVLVCLPNENRERRREEKNSFTLLFAQKMAASRHSSLKTVITSTAYKWKYHVDSQLFYA